MYHGLWHFFSNLQAVVMRGFSGWTVHVYSITSSSVSGGGCIVDVWANRSAGLALGPVCAALTALPSATGCSNLRLEPQMIEHYVL